MNKPISIAELKVVEKTLDKLFSSLGIDIEFTKHFRERLNDNRNKKQITSLELIQIYKDVKQKFGGKLSKASGEIEKLIKSASTAINIPVAIKYDRTKKEVEIIAKTIMRKKGFKSSTPQLNVESIFSLGSRKYDKNDVEVFLSSFNMPTLSLVKQVVKSHNPVIVIVTGGKLSSATIKKIITNEISDLGGTVKPMFIESYVGLSSLYKTLSKMNFVIKTIVTDTKRVNTIQTQLKMLQKRGIGERTRINVYKDNSNRALTAIFNQNYDMMRDVIGKTSTGMYSMLLKSLR